MQNGRLSRVITRRGFVAATAASATALGLGMTTSGQATTPVASPVVTPQGSAKPFLLVTDRNEPTMWFYSIPNGGEPVGKLDDVLMASHASAFVLPDGRLIYGTLHDQAINALVLDDDGVPSIVASVPATLGESAAWIVSDPDFRYIAFGSLIEGDVQTLNLIDLATFTNTQLEFEMNEPEEITAWLLGDPLSLHVSVGGRIDSYELSAILSGDTTPLGSEEVDLGSHGGATDVINNQLFYVTAPGQGVDVLDVSSGVASWVAQIPWDIDGQAGGYNPRPQVTSDGGYIFGAISTTVDDSSDWTSIEAANYVVSMADRTARRIPLGTGQFTSRWVMGTKVALFAAYNENGGTAYVVDADAQSSTFGEAVGQISIPVPSEGLTPGEFRDDAQIYYVCAITADDAWGFVSIPGDGKVLILDLVAGEVSGEIETETSLAGFGYSKVIQAGVVPTDLWGR